MNDDFLLVHKSVLPEVFLSVIKARERIQRDGLSVTQACKIENISRSVYYKYKDYVFLPDHSVIKKAIFSFCVNDTPGVLNAMLRTLYEAKVNVLTIQQEMPIDRIAYITMTLDIKSLSTTIDELLSSLSHIENVRKVTIVAYE